MKLYNKTKLDRARALGVEVSGAEETIAGTVNAEHRRRFGELAQARNELHIDTKGDRQ